MAVLVLRVERLWALCLVSYGRLKNGRTMMTAPEPLCDLKIVKADYRLVTHKDREPDYCFRIRVIAGKQEMQFDIPEKSGELFAAELEALAAIIRSRVIRARLIGEEKAAHF